MNNVNKTLYIPLYGKSYVSKKGLFLDDKMAEKIWEAEGFELKGKSKSKWLAYYMGVRSAVFDEWVKSEMAEHSDATVLHLGCGMDSRALRVGTQGHKWYDVDFPDVIVERKRYFDETEDYSMIGSDVRDGKWLDTISESGRAIVIMEGISMYLTESEMQDILAGLGAHFDELAILVDSYTSLAAKMSKYKNPVKDVGVTTVYGIDDPTAYAKGDITFVKEHNMTPEKYINELSGFERAVFAKLYAGSFSKKLYRMYEYEKRIKQ